MVSKTVRVGYIKVYNNPRKFGLEEVSDKIIHPLLSKMDIIMKPLRSQGLLVELECELRESLFNLGLCKHGAGNAGSRCDVGEFRTISLVGKKGWVTRNSETDIERDVGHIGKTAKG